MTIQDSYNSLLGIIDSLYQKLQEANINLWQSEQKIIDLEQQLTEKNQQLEDLQQTVKHQEKEIEDLGNTLNTSTDADKYFQILEEKQELHKKYIRVSEILKQFCDIDYVL
jgi:septal ring factor EnvC (AmiA/AmiB activator)